MDTSNELLAEQKTLDRKELNSVMKHRFELDHNITDLFKETLYKSSHQLEKIVQV